MEKTHNLIIDIGNSRVKFYHSDEVFFSLGELCASLPELAQANFKVFVVSTVGAATNRIIDTTKHALASVGIKKIDIEIFSSDKQSLVTGLYPNIGADRVAKLCGAAKIFPQKNIALIDFGTAVTMSLLDKQAKFRGGFITLGQRACLKALSDACFELDNFSNCIDEVEVSSLLQEPFSPKKAMLEGTVSAQRALVQSWLGLACQSFPAEDFVSICAGGEAVYFNEFFDHHYSDFELLASGVEALALCNEKSI